MYVTGTIVPHMSNLTECSSDAEAKCPSLRDHKNSFLLLLVFHGLYPGEKDALDGWTISRDGQNLYHSLMNTFSSTKEAAEYLLILAVFLCVPPYWKMSSTHGSHQPPNDPLPDLGNFVEEQGPVDRRIILEETAFAAIRVLTDETFNLRFEKPQQTERKYLSTVLMYAVGKGQPMLGCSEGPLDPYCEARIGKPVDHAEAFRILWALATAKHLPHKLSYDRSDSTEKFPCSRTTSSTTLRGSICDTASFATPKGGICDATPSDTLDSIKVQNAHVKCGLVIKAGPDHVFTIRFVGMRGVGKSEIINRVSRAPSRPKSLLIP
jgi:hypothetical protein